MPQMTRQQYLSLRNKYKPKKIKLVIIAESPPQAGTYFYDSNGRTTEALFSALMRQLDLCPVTKKEGLRKFKEHGWLLVDATYKPVNGLSRSKRNKVIERDAHVLQRDLRKLISDRSTPVILIKANVCRILEPKLAETSFNVVNKNVVYFPNNGRQPEFHRQFRAILKSAEL